MERSAAELFSNLATVLVDYKFSSQTAGSSRVLLLLARELRELDCIEYSIRRSMCHVVQRGEKIIAVGLILAHL